MFDLQNCTVEMIADMGGGFISKEKDKRNNVSFNNSKKTIQFFTPGVKRVRGFIKCANTDETIIFESK